MPPSQRPRRRPGPRQPSPASAPTAPPVPNDAAQLFVDPMLGVPLSLYIDLDVADRPRLVELVKKHGGNISSGYSSVPYILVDPTKESGRSLYLQYAGKKGKVVLDAEWVHRCVEAGQLQSYQNDFAGCKVNGGERPIPNNPSRVPQADPVPENPAPPVPVPSHVPRVDVVGPEIPQPPQPHDATLVAAHPADHQQPALIHHNGLIYNAVARPPMHPGQPAPPPPAPQWNPPNLSSSSGRTVAYQPAPPIPTWSEPFDAMNHPPPNPYEFHYRSDDQWAQSTADFYSQQFDQSAPFTTHQQYSPLPAANTLQTDVVEPSERGRKRQKPRTQPDNSKKPRFAVATRAADRSPTPPTRVLKSTHGGNHFTEDDVKYLGRYIDYCRQQGLALSLREICERLAVKAPHHTFYSWRRYCNKHQIRLGGYEMEEVSSDDSGSEQENDADDVEETTRESMDHASPDAPILIGSDGNATRLRSPSPPRLLFRSTTGKGVAFTTADVTFLVRYLDYYRSKQDDVNMVQFWKRVAEKAPHHSRASWMKYWRRHKHELDGSTPAVPRPEKKRKYDSTDDMLLARYFAKKPSGTSDSIFQSFSREYPHHPWKGWQEHHRIHKAKIDHLILQIRNGEIADPLLDPSLEAA